MNNNIKRARELKKMTQQECADALGVKLRAWQTYEQGVSEPKYELLCKIADMFDVTTDYLLGRESKKEQSLDYAEVKEKTDALIERIENLPPAYQDIMVKVLHMLHDVDQKAQSPELRQSSMEYVGTIGEKLAERQQAEAEAEALRKDTA